MAATGVRAQACTETSRGRAIPLQVSCSQVFKPCLAWPDPQSHNYHNPNCLFSSQPHGALGRHLPLKIEHLFLHLSFWGKSPKWLPDGFLFVYIVAHVYFILKKKKSKFCLNILPCTPFGRVYIVSQEMINRKPEQAQGRHQEEPQVYNRGAMLWSLFM